MIYGGARIGLMGEVANACLYNNGHVIGIIPGFLSDKEIIHEGLTETIQTKSMHERKALMEEMADGFIAIPGGFGTLDELFEILTWSQLGLHNKPVGLINIDGFFEPLLTMIQNMEASQLLKTKHKDMLLLANNVTELIGLMKTYQAPEQPKWIKRTEES